MVFLLSHRVAGCFLAACLLGMVGCARAPTPPSQRVALDASYPVPMADDVTVSAPRCDPSPSCPTAIASERDLGSSSQWQRIRALATMPPESIDLAEVSALVSQAAHPTVSVVATLTRLDAMAEEIRRATPVGCEGACRARLLARHVTRTWRFRAAGDPNQLYNDPDLDLIDRVLARREGYCEGLSVLYLALARRLDIPMVAVLARQHVYVRYVGPGGPLDLDPTRGGLPPVRGRACPAAPGVYGVALDARAMVPHVASVVGIMEALPARRAWIDNVLELLPRDPDLLNNRGVERERGYDMEGALADYRAATALDPCVSLYRVNAVAALRRMGRLDEAAAELDTLELLASRGAADDDVVARVIARADLAHERGDDTTAERLYARALVVSRHAPVAWEARALARLARGDARGAAEDLLAALETDPRAETRVWLTEALLALGERSARSELARAERDGALPGDTAYWRAAVALAAGEVEEGTQLARVCLETYGPRCARALVLLGDAAARRGDTVCAARYWEAFLGCRYPPRDRYRRRIDASLRERLASLGWDGGTFQGTEGEASVHGGDRRVVESAREVGTY